MDSRAQAFCIPEDKKIKLAQLREQILLRGSTIFTEVNGEMQFLFAGFSSD